MMLRRSPVGEGGAGEVGLAEYPHGDFAAPVVVCSVGGLGEGEVVSDGEVWELGVVFVDPVGHAGQDPEDCDHQWHGGEDTSDECHCQTASKAPCNEQWGSNGK